MRLIPASCRSQALPGRKLPAQEAAFDPDSKGEGLLELSTNSRQSSFKTRECAPMRNGLRIPSACFQQSLHSNRTPKPSVQVLLARPVPVAYVSRHPAAAVTELTGGKWATRDHSDGNWIWNCLSLAFLLPPTLRTGATSRNHSPLNLKPHFWWI